MTHEQTDALLAGYLEGELSGDDQRRFEAMLAADAALAAQAASLRRALNELRTLEAPAAALGAVAAPSTLRRDASTSNRPRVIALAGLRYAAVFALAFSTGYALKSAGHRHPAVIEGVSAPLSDGASVRSPASSGSVALAEILLLDDAAAQRVAAAYNASQADSGLARSLIAISAATPPAHVPRK